METNPLLEKYFPSLYVKSFAKGKKNSFHDVILLGDRRIDLVVSNGFLNIYSWIPSYSLNSSLNPNKNSYLISPPINKKLIPNYSPRAALDNAEFCIFSRIKYLAEKLQKNPFGDDPDPKKNREILEGTPFSGLEKFLSHLTEREDLGIAS